MAWPLGAKEMSDPTGKLANMTTTPRPDAVDALVRAAEELLSQAASPGRARHCARPTARQERYVEIDTSVAGGEGREASHGTHT